MSIKMSTTSTEDQNSSSQARPNFDSSAPGVRRAQHSQLSDQNTPSDEYYFTQLNPAYLESLARFSTKQDNDTLDLSLQDLKNEELSEDEKELLGVHQGQQSADAAQEHEMKKKKQKKMKKKLSSFISKSSHGTAEEDTLRGVSMERSTVQKDAIPPAYKIGRGRVMKKHAGVIGRAGAGVLCTIAEQTDEE